MKENFRVIIMPLWRRKYICFCGCILWSLFYLYLHYSTSVEDVTYSSGQSVKHPVDVRSSSSDEKYSSKFKTLIERSEFESTSAGVFKAATKDEFVDKYTKLSVENEFRLHKQNAEDRKKDQLFKQKSREEEMQKSVREKYANSGVKAESFLVRSKQKPSTYATGMENVSTDQPKPRKYSPLIRLVHFDLKGAPPKTTFFKSIFPLLKEAGANGLLMEYEDTFPFWGPLSTIAALNAYKRREIRYILELAKNYDLLVIPLVQTFGHLEFVLKLSEFKNLREVSDIPQSVCPTNNATLEMVKMMIDQVMALHPDSKWLHIGSDEVYQLGNCPRCSRYDRNSLFLAYVRKVSRYVRAHHKVTPLMWDDMLRHTTVAELEKYELGKLVEPMAWSYVEDVYVFLPGSLWEKYSQIFPYMWTASAYKGAFGETLTVPDAKRHLENNLSWLNIMSEQNSSFSAFRGIALTGWQRYDHFSSLCELLPAGLPSLILNLLTLSQGQFDYKVFVRMQELLECSSRMHYHLDLEHDPNMWRALGVCFFPGSAIFRLTLRHYDVTKSLDKYIDDITTNKGWMTEYNINHNFSSPLRVNEMLKDFGYYNSSLQMLQEAAVKALREVYDDYTVSEWIELKIYPYVTKMNEIWKHGLRLKKYSTWPRRPLRKRIDLPPTTKLDLEFITS